METAQKEALLCGGVSADESADESSPQDAAQLVEEHSPAAYIDPTPQPDIGMFFLYLWN